MELHVTAKGLKREEGRVKNKERREENDGK
jgi:hypothetical protein